ncbi:flowering time control protein FCA-like isoform X1 [Neltuma alba]|uniref:flowering time control protein FCA-like isoform X1 n=1 Tax=Neltuma alba TaxID=207710 RepID=UPI0010A3FD2A|nr:flowering time control protein FCA-like isoform X1 [Prosopis alba]
MENLNNHPDQRVTGNGLPPPPPPSSHPIHPHIHEPFFNHCNFLQPNGHDPHIAGNFTYPHVPGPPNGFANHNQPYNHFNHMNGDPNNSFGAGGPPSTNGNSGYGFNHPLPRPGRKRGWHPSTQGASPDQVDGAYNVKLYIAPVPRTSTENDIRLVFEEHGTIVEVVLLRDKKTGERQGSCFVKFATLDEAERAIKALSNRYTFTGESSPIVVRFADREKERLGIRGFPQIMDKKNLSEEAVDKVFVGCINKEASKKEIEEVFSPYGHVEDIFIAQSRGYCFVKFSNRDMALAAIKALNNAFTMRGCDHPLIVRFADPKKPKTGEPRVNHMPGSAFGPCSQEPAVWLPPNYGDSTGGSNLPMAPHHPTIPHPQVAPHIQNWQPANAMVQQPFPSKQAHPQLAPMPSQSMQAQKLSSQPVVTEVLKQSHPTDSSSQNIVEQQINTQPSQTGGSPCAVAGSTSPNMPESPDDEVFPECDWSEHICPDGNKYYYNCVTCESRWEKPDEYALYENKLQEQEDHGCPNS